MNGVPLPTSGNTLLETIAMTASRKEAALQRLNFARNYSLGLLEDIDEADWFRMPAEGVTHVAWQVGHLAIAEYGLALVRTRGAKQEDEQLLSTEFRELFGKGSTPEADAAKYPPTDAIRKTLDHVHTAVLSEIAAMSDDALSQPVDKPHAMFATKIEALEFCASHELIHAGQIALLRRLLGKTPLR